MLFILQVSILSEQITTSKSKLSTLLYILVINLFSSNVISKSKKVSIVLYKSSSKRNRFGINIFRTYHKFIIVIHITNPNIIYISTVIT